MILFSGLMAMALASGGSLSRGVAFPANPLAVPRDGIALSIQTRGDGFVIRRQAAQLPPPTALPQHLRLGSTVVFDIRNVARSRGTQGPGKGPKL
ncbi:hypothetical protein SPH9361_03583 [Sphingobium sp. CECT 9361]|nr:hypothetical protein SPH9361_03583 [Sphingobium sp. CECT 9361]